MPLEYANPKVLVDTQWVEDHLAVPHISVSQADYHFKVIFVKLDYQRYFKKKEIVA